MPSLLNTGRGLFVSLSLLSLNLAAQEQEASAEESKETVGVSTEQDSTFVLGEIVMRANRTGTLPAVSVLTSVDVLGSGLVEKQNVGSAWELFSRAPGVLLTEFNQGTTSGKLSFRGFNGEGEINAVKLLIDGIPGNSNDGNMPFIDLVFPLEIESLEVVRGTNDPRYGLYNIAGNVGINTHQEGDYAHGRVSVGSFSTAEAQLAKGIDAGGLAQNYFVGYRRSDGFRDHSESDKYSLTGKWFYRLDGEGSRAGFIARHGHVEGEEPGYLEVDDARANPTMSEDFTATDGSERRLGQYSGHLELALSPQMFLTSRAYLNSYDDRRFVQFSRSVAQQERVTDETHYGVLSTLTYRPAVAWVRSLSIEGGLNAERQRNETSRFTTDDRVRLSRTRDQAFDLDNLGGFVQAVVQVNDAVKLVPAFRVDHFSGHLSNYVAGTYFNANDYGWIQQPKFSAVWTPTQGYSLYGNWGRSFQIGVGASAYKVPPRVNDLEPSINTGWEVGVKASPARWLESRLSLWTQKATGEERRRLNDPSNESDNIGTTRRKGVDLQIDIRPSDRLNAWLTYSYQDAVIVVPDPAQPQTSGKEIDHIPHNMYTLGVDYQATTALNVSAALAGQSSYYLERNNDRGKFGDFVAVNLGVSYQVKQWLAVDFQIKNLFDRYYEYVWHDGTISLHSPADGRAFYLGADVRF